jgi:hypothetical protein
MGAKWNYTLLALLAFVCVKAQVNLVPNGSFEITDSCPYGDFKLYLARPWFCPNVGTSDLFNNCNIQTDDYASVPDNSNGFEYPKDGNGYSGIGIYVPAETSDREYLAIKLDTLLKKNKYYCFTMYCSLFDIFYEGYISQVNDGLPPSSSVYTTSNIGVYFSEDSLFQNSWAPLPYIPQIQNPVSNIIDSLTGWKKVEGYFKSETGEEQYIYIGNFNDNANTPLTVLYQGSNPEPWVYFYIDDISLYECDSVVGIDEKPIEQIKIYPNPAQDFVSIDLPKNINQAQLSIYNLTGQLVTQKQIAQANQQIPITELGNGVYVFVVESGGEVVGRRRVVISK